jgi:hypothetical protein
LKDKIKKNNKEDKRKEKGDEKKKNVSITSNPHHRDTLPHKEAITEMISKTPKKAIVRSRGSCMHHHIATTTSSHRCGACPPLYSLP